MSNKLDLRDRKLEAVRRLGVTPEMMRGVPEITHIFKFAKGGIRQIIQALKGYDDDDARKFIAKWESISLSDQQRVSVEQVATAAGISTIDLLACAQKALYQQTQAASALLAASSHPSVVEKTIEYALDPGGHRDRKMLHDSQNFLPLAKGSVFVTNRVQVANFKDSQDKPPNTIETPDIPELPSIDDDLQGFDDFERKLLKP